MNCFVQKKTFFCTEDYILLYKDVLTSRLISENSNERIIFPDRMLNKKPFYLC